MLCYASSHVRASPPTAHGVVQAAGRKTSSPPCLCHRAAAILQKRKPLAWLAICQPQPPARKHCTCNQPRANANCYYCTLRQYRLNHAAPMAPACLLPRAQRLSRALPHPVSPAASAMHSAQMVQLRAPAPWRLWPASWGAPAGASARPRHALAYQTPARGGPAAAVAAAVPMRAGVQEAQPQAAAGVASRGGCAACCCCGCWLPLTSPPKDGGRESHWPAAAGATPPPLSP